MRNHSPFFMTNKEIKESISKIDEKQDHLEHQLVKTHTLLEVHIEGDSLLHKKIASIQDELKVTNQHLSEYNAQLAVHIAGVMELKKANELFREQIDLYKKDSEIRLKKLEAPHIWAEETRKYARWLYYIAAGVTVIFSFIKWVWPLILS